MALRSSDLQEPFALARALQEAFGRQAPVFVFANWQPAGPLPSSIGWLLLSMPPRLTLPPLNPTVGFFPFTGTDSATLAVERRPVELVERARSRARARRHETGQVKRGDLALSDWEFAARKRSTPQKARSLGLKSYVAVDSVQGDGSILAGVRPVLGSRVRRGEPRLPCLVGLHTRNASEDSVLELSRSDLVLVSLHQCRGPKTHTTALELLDRLGDGPAIILAENGSEIAPFVGTSAVRGVALTLSSQPCPTLPIQDLSMVIRDRIQHEQQFRWALPQEDLTEEEQALWRIAVGTWRAQWRRLHSGESLGPVTVFREALIDLKRRQPSSGDRFALVDRLFSELEPAMRLAAEERRDRVLNVLREGKDPGSLATTVLVNSVGDHAALTAEIQSLAGLVRARVAVARHVGDTAMQSDLCVVVGYAGPPTLDAIIRLQPKQVVWVLDPVEAALAEKDAKSQSWHLSRLGLDDASGLLGGYAETLSAGAGDLTPTGESFLSVAQEAGAPTMDQDSDLGRGIQGFELTEDILDPDPSASLFLADGSVLHVDGGRRFDVVRAGDTKPQTLSAGDLQPGDQLLVVRGEYQRTLSELLLEDMDTTEIKDEATARQAWASLCRSFASRSPLSAAGLAEQICALGGQATAETVRSWLLPGPASSTPRDWRTFVAFATVLGLDLPEEAIQMMFNKIRRWRVAHRLRGREIIRLCRAAWFGRLPASDLASIEERWGLTVRDLVEGSRVVEVESVAVASEGSS